MTELPAAIRAYQGPTDSSEEAFFDVEVDVGFQCAGGASGRNSGD
jgi:hypothetical protein